MPTRPELSMRMRSVSTVANDKLSPAPELLSCKTPVLGFCIFNLTLVPSKKAISEPPSTSKGALGELVPIPNRSALASQKNFAVVPVSS